MQQLGCDDPNWIKDERSCHIRVGNDGNGGLGPVLYIESNHAAVGILEVYKDPDSYDIIVKTDWQPGEESRGFSVTPDAQLAALGVTGGCSGGATTTIVRLYATRAIRRYPGHGTNSTTWAAGAQLPPHGSWADLNSCNFTLTLKSIRPKTT